MPIAYFYKELVSSPVVVAGKPVHWEQLDGNRGVIAVNVEADKALAEGLQKLANDHRGGVVVITEAVYQDKKKALPFNPLKASGKGRESMLRPISQNSDPFRRVKPSAAAVSSTPSEPPVQNASAPPVESLRESAPKPGIVFQPATARVGRKSGKLAAAMQQKL